MRDGVVRIWLNIAARRLLSRGENGLFEFELSAAGAYPGSAKTIFMLVQISIEGGIINGKDRGRQDVLP